MSARRAALALALVLLALSAAAYGDAGAAGSSGPGHGRHVVLIRVSPASFDQLLRVRDVARLAAAGGAGLLSWTGALSPHARSDRPTRGVDDDVEYLISRPSQFRAVGEAIRDRVVRYGGSNVLVVVTSLVSTSEMRAAKDDLHPVVVAEGPPESLFGAGAPRSLTSDSTRRVGVVTDADVVATIAAFRGWATTGPGFPIRFVDRPAPFELHERYVAMRRMWIPVQTAAALYVTIAGVFCLAILALGSRAPRPLGIVGSGAAISVGPLAAALLAAGHLPALSYATVVPFVVGATAVLVALVLVGAARDLLRPVLPLAVVLLVFLLVEALLGWTAALTPFLGGSELDGGRFYGLPNVFIGLLLGSALYAASRISPVAGFGLLVAAGLFAGLPFAGANLGGAITLFAAAGLWLPLRARGRLGWRELGFAAAVVIAGTAVVLVAHRFSALPTHVTRFEETEGAAGAWSAFVDRLGVGWRLIRRNPFALVPVVGMLVTLGVMLRPPVAVATSLARHPAWRDTLLVILLASVVAYVANDSGPAACGVGFGMALGGLLYVSVAERTWKMVPA